MSNILRIAIVDPREDSREQIKKLILGIDQLWLEAECSRFDFFADVIEQTEPDIGLIVLDADIEKGLALVERVRIASPGCLLLVVSSSTDGQTILRAMRAGVTEFLPLPLKLEDFAAALDRIMTAKFGGTGKGKSRSSQAYAIAGATGGVGSTSLAVNLGAMLAANPAHSVCLVDLDLALGDADVYLDTIPDYTLVDVAQNISRLDFTLLKRSLTRHGSGLYLLPRPVQLQDMHLITPSDLQRVLGLLKASFTHLIFDLSKTYNDLDMAALRAANLIFLVTQLDLPCLRNVVRLMMSFEQEEGLREKIRVIINRSGLDTGQISLKKAQETIGSEIFWQIPNDYRTMSEVRNNGVPLVEHAPRAALTQSFRMLAEELQHAGPAPTAAEPTPGQKSKAWFGFLAPKK